MSDNNTDKTEGQQAARRIIDAINVEINSLVNADKKDAAWHMQYIVYRQLAERFEK